MIKSGAVALQDTADYGRKEAIWASVSLHLLILLLGIGYHYWAPNHKEPPLTVNRVRLGGPANMELGGKKHKAPVVGKKPKPSEAAPKKDAPKTPPKVDDKQLGLKKKEPKKEPKKQPKQEAKKETKEPAKTPSKPKKAEPEAKTESSAPEVKIQPDPDEDKNAPKAIGGLGGDKGVALDLGDGAESINLDDRDFINYYKVVQSALLERWQSKGLKGGAAMIRFEINRDGTLNDVSVAKSSGKPYLDGPAKRAVMGAQFPPLPQSYEGQVLVLNIIFNYDRQ